MENGNRSESRSATRYYLENAVPAIVLGILFLLGSVGTVAIYGTPWESKEKADAQAALFNAQISETAGKLKEVADLNKQTAGELSGLRTDLAVAQEHQRQEDQRLEALEVEHPWRQQRSKP